MFLILLHYDHGTAPVDAHLEAHAAWLEGHYRTGLFLLSGRRVPRTGGVILCRATDRSLVEELVRTDPFHLHGAARHEIVEFVPTRWNRESEGLGCAFGLRQVSM